MAPLLLFACLFAVATSLELPWQDLSLSIERDWSTSSETVTLCRVRVENHGARTWPGHDLRFEAHALDGGLIVARERGRFGLSLKPHESLETLIAFPGRYDRFEVQPLVGAGGDRSGSGGRSKSRSARPRRGRRH